MMQRKPLLLIHLRDAAGGPQMMSREKCVEGRCVGSGGRSEGAAGSAAAAVRPVHGCVCVGVCVCGGGGFAFITDSSHMNHEK